MSKKTNSLTSHHGESRNFRFDKMIPKETMKFVRSDVVFDKDGNLIREDGKIKTEYSCDKCSKKFKKFYTHKRRMYIKNDTKKQLENGE